MPQPHRTPGPASALLALLLATALATKIGAPKSWKTCAGLELKPDDYMGNLLQVNAWSTADRLPDLQRPVDRTRWNTSPQLVNAFAAGGNQIVFPAGILLPPFFDERADQVAALYSGYELLPGERSNGRQTPVENLSDVGGMQIAFAGLQIALERQRKAGKPAPLVDGHAPEQRFFMANAVVWRTKHRNEALVNQIRVGQHSPGRWRILGPMSNMQSFAEAFSCKPGDAMAAGSPIVVW